jgi:hypothetical protein
MGMFDYVRCEYPLPAPEIQGHLFQTKDTPEPVMRTWVIGADGGLQLEKDPPPGVPVWGLIRGPFGIYTSDEGWWYDVDFEFINGRVSSVKVSKSPLQTPSTS